MRSSERRVLLPIPANSPQNKAKSCKFCRISMALPGNFDTIEVRVHFGANGCIRVQFVPVFVTSDHYSGVQSFFQLQKHYHCAIVIKIKEFVPLP